MVLSLTGALWTQPSLADAARPSLRRIAPRHLALLGLPVVLVWYNIRWSADKLAMADGTPWKTSCSITDRASTQGGTTGNELYGKLSRLLLLSLPHRNGHSETLWMPRPRLPMRKTATSQMRMTYGR